MCVRDCGAARIRIYTYIYVFNIPRLCALTLPSAPKTIIDVNHSRSTHKSKTVNVTHRCLPYIPETNVTVHCLESGAAKTDPSKTVNVSSGAGRVEAGGGGGVTVWNKVYTAYTPLHNTPIFAHRYDSLEGVRQDRGHGCRQGSRRETQKRRQPQRHDLLAQVGVKHLRL